MSNVLASISMGVKLNPAMKDLRQRTPFCVCHVISSLLPTGFATYNRVIFVFSFYERLLFGANDTMNIYF